MPSTETGDVNERDAPHLQVRLLGPPEVTWDGEPLVISRRQPRAILYRLASEPAPIPRGRFCLLLWPDIPESDARRNLSNQLYHLRRALPERDLVQTAGDQLTLDHERVRSDVITFQRRCADLGNGASTEELQRAVDLYRGPFLAGFSLVEAGEFEAWAGQQRRILERQCLDALLSLVDAYAAYGNYDAAITYAQRYLEIDDVAEGVHRRLIDLYANRGDRSAALQQYEHCAAVLERELGVDPLPETRDLYQAVRTGQTTPAEPEPPSPTWTTLPSLEAPLVGRDEALSRLDAVLARVRSGLGQTVLVVGEAGVGKSRLLEEFVTERAGDARVLTGSGYEVEGQVPYLPLTEALRPRLGTIDWTSLGAEPLHLAQVARILPELWRHVSDLPNAALDTEEQQQSPLFRGLAHLVLRLARTHPPLVLCLDDLQWADEATRSWLGYLSHHLQEAPILLLGAYRTEEADAVASLRAGLDRQGLLDEVSLKGLSEREVQHLVRRLSAQSGGAEAFSRRLHRQTGGNPFFLLETLRTLFEVGVLQEDDTGWRTDVDQVTLAYAEVPWPDTVMEAVRRRVGKVRPETYQVLQAGAVLGHRFDLELLQATSGRSEHEVIAALEELTARHLLVETEGRYQFAHDVTRAIVGDDLSYGRRRLLHRRAGEALEEHGVDDTASLARHFAAAGVAEKAIDYSLHAGQQARLLYAHAEAVDHYRRAVDLLKAQGDEARAARTLMTLGLTYHNAFEFEKSRETYDDAFALQRRAVQKEPAASLPSAPHPLRISWYEPATLDASRCRSYYATQIIPHLFSGLVARTPELEVAPDLARSWEVLEEGRVYVFHLREDIRWSDGVPLTAGDVEYAWKRVLAPATNSPSADSLYDVKGARAFHSGDVSHPDEVGVRAVDEETLVVELEQPVGYFLHLLTLKETFPIPRHVIEAHGEDWTDVRNIVTSGPFRLESWQRGERLVLARNPAYHGRFTGNLERVAFIPIGDGTALLEHYESDDLDVLVPRELSHEDRVRARRKHAENHLQAPWLVTEYIGFDTSRAPFNDPRVRRAFTLALNRERLVEEAWHGYHVPPRGGFVPAEMPGHAAGVALPYDPDRARRLLAEAGYPDGDGFPPVEALMRGQEMDRQAVEDMRTQWRESLSIQIQWRRVEFQTLSARLYDGDPPNMWTLGWVADYPDPHYFLMVGLKRQPFGWEHEGYWRLVEGAQRTTDQEQRMRLYREAEEILAEQAPLIPLLYRRLYLLVKPWVRTYPISPQDVGFFKDAIVAPH